MQTPAAKARHKRRNLTISENLTKRAYKSIKEKLFLNEIMPEQKINYRDLAKSMNISPTPVIQALKWLEFQGIVNNEPNRGFYLGPVGIEEIREVYDLRETLETSLLPRVVEKLNDEGIRRLKMDIESHKKAIAGGYRHCRLIAAMNFHLTLASLSGGSISVRFLHQLSDILYLKYKPDLLFSTPVDQYNYRHEEILEYLMDRDLEKAQKALVEDIHHVRDHVLNDIRLALEEKGNFTV